MTKLIDLLPKATDDGSPVFQTFWAIGHYDETIKDRPWLTMIAVGDGSLYLPISHQPPRSTQNPKHFFPLKLGSQGLEMLDVDVDSWICGNEGPKKIAFSKWNKPRRSGIITGPISSQIAAWIKTIPHSNPRPKAGQNVSSFPLLIEPWINQAGYRDASTATESLALDIYASAEYIRRKNQECSYIPARRSLAISSPLPHYRCWVWAYCEFLWENILSDKQRSRWIDLLELPSNIRIARLLISDAISSTSHLHTGIDNESIARRTFASASSQYLLPPSRQLPASISAYLEEIAEPMLFSI